MYKRKRDKNGMLEFSHIILAKPGKRIYTVLNGVDCTTVSITRKCNNLSTLTFEVDRYIDIDGEYVESSAYRDIEELMELYCDGIWFVISSPPKITFDGWKERKIIEAESYEVRLQQFVLNNFYINMGTKDSQEMIYASEHDTSLYYQIKFCDKNNKKLSLLHLVLSHADVKGWTIGYVDNITVNETDGTTLLPDEVSFFEVDTCSVYSFLTQQVSQAFSCIFVFDTENLTINAYRAESLGNNTNIVLSYRNVQNGLTKTRDNQLVTAFKVSGADGINIDYVNFGTNIIFNYDYFMREPYMDVTLVSKVKAWLTYREEQREIYIDLTKKYNKNLEILSELENRVPIDKVQNDWFSVKLEDLKIAYSDNVSIIRGLESLYVDDKGQFDLEALKKSPDWPLYESTMNYTLPSIVAAIQANGDKVEGFGTGNVINNVNPITLDKDWLTIGANNADVTTEQVQDSPAYGITRSVKASFNNPGLAGIMQQSIAVEESQDYVLSCYAKGSGVLNLEYGKTGDERTQHSFSTSSVWTRVFVTFNAPAKLIHIAFTSDSNFEICGMQLEMGTNPSQFGFFIQDENVIKAWETDWKLYGIKELENKISVYENSIETLKKNGYSVSYSSLSQFSEDYHTQMYQKYKDLLKLKAEAEVALEERRAEYDSAQLPEIQKRLEEIARLVEPDNFGKQGLYYDVTPKITSSGVLQFNEISTPVVDNNGKLIFPSYVIPSVDKNGTLEMEAIFEPFTEKELFILNSLYNENEYTNENILITTLDDLSDAVDKQKVLYDDAVDRLFVESHPQYSYENDVNSIYALPEFADFDSDLDVGNFLCIENEDGKFVKLRCIEITYNPCSWDETMELVFSDMVQYKTKRSDVASLIADLESSSRKSQIVDAGKGKDITEYVFTPEAIKKLFSNPLFQSMIGGTTVGGAGSGGTINADVIIAELVKAKEGIFDKLTADTAFIKYLDVTLVNADKIVTKVLEADKAKIEELAATIINAHEISADIATIKELFVNNEGVTNLHVLNLTAKNVTIDDAVIKDIIAARISVADLLTHSATAELITLISDDGKPTIAFQNSTQQFYDKDGNVRVQIGQDGTGDFNFVVRGEDGSTILLDSTGIKRDGIPDNTIITNMVDDKAITPNKVSWKIETDDNGNQITSIENVYMGNGDKFGVHYTQMIEDVNALKSGVKTISLYSDKQVFIEDNDVVTPSEIKIQALLRGGAAVSYWYIDDIEIEENRGKTSITIPSSKLNRDKKSITIKASDASGAIYDVISLFYIVSGTDGVTVTVSSSNGTVFKDSEGIDKTELSCTVYKGAKQVIPNWYKWYKLENNTWKQIATTPTIAITVSALIHSENYKCEVDI